MQVQLSNVNFKTKTFYVKTIRLDFMSFSKYYETNESTRDIKAVLLLNYLIVANVTCLSYY